MVCFSGCSSLSSLHDISKWNTNKVTDMSDMFSDCLSLSSLPNISRWNTNKVTDNRFMVYGCLNIIISNPIIDKFNL